MRNAVLAVLFGSLAACAPRTPYLPVDDLDRDIPHRSLEAACAEFAPPDADGAFLFAADILDETTRARDGELHVAVEAGTFKGEPAWFVDETWDDSGVRYGSGAHEVKHVRTWLAGDLRLLSSVEDVDLSRVDGGVDHTRHEFGPTEHGYWIATTKGDGSTSREESTSDGPCWARTFAGAMVFLRRCPPDPALYVGKREDLLTVRTAADGTMTLGGFGHSTGVTARVADRAPIVLHEHIWELSPRRFEVRGAPR